jgi:hypothetical protein
MAAEPPMALIDIGFWRRFQDASADPEDLRRWPERGTSRVSRDDVLAYLELGFVESMEFGYAECRLCGRSGPALGCLSLTDGTYVWPEGLAHYLREHNVHLPADFETHAVAKLEWLRATHRFQQNAAEPLLEWTNSGPVVAPLETVAWVRQHTNYGKPGCFNRLCCYWHGLCL